jgi:cell wall-associated NlpC family hydrolase
MTVSSVLRGLTCVLALTATACASTGAVPRPFPSPRGSAGAPPPAVDKVDSVDTAHSAPEPSPVVSAPDGYALVGTALNLRGTPYRNGGSDPNGFDCSGFTQYVFAQHGIALPRDVQDQSQLGKKVEPADLAMGDLVFFSTVARGASHVGIAIGGDQFVHAPSSTGVVRVEHLSAAYWSQRFVAARRVNP